MFLDDEELFVEEMMLQSMFNMQMSKILTIFKEKKWKIAKW